MTGSSLNRTIATCLVAIVLSSTLAASGEARYRSHYDDLPGYSGGDLLKKAIVPALVIVGAVVVYRIATADHNPKSEYPPTTRTPEAPDSTVSGQSHFPPPIDSPELKPSFTVGPNVDWNRRSIGLQAHISF